MCPKTEKYPPYWIPKCNCLNVEMILEHPKTISVKLCAMRSGRVNLSWEAWKSLMRQRVSRKLSSWSLAFSLTHTLIFHSRVSLVYGSTCSLLVLSYYKCLLRLNSDIAKAFASVPTVLERPWARPWAWNSVRMLLIRIASGTTLSLWIKARSLPYTGIYHH